MFAVTSAETGEESQEMMDHIVNIQTDLFSNLGLHLRFVLNFLNLSPQLRWNYFTLTYSGL